MQASVKRIEENPKQFAKKFGNIRATQTKRFPYIIYFLIQKIKIIIIAVLHGSRYSSKHLQNE